MLNFDIDIENTKALNITWDMTNKQYVELYKLLQSLHATEYDLYQFIKHKQLLNTY